MYGLIGKITAIAGRRDALASILIDGTASMRLSRRVTARQPERSVTGWDSQRTTLCREVVLTEDTMAQVDWYIEGVEFSNCNCDYACPCQFESPRPTHGDCRGFAAVRIDKGHFGDVPLDGLGAALLYAWPGPIYEGNGECQAVIDERADEKQRNALATVLNGGETNDGCDPLVGLYDDVEHCPSPALQADRV